MTIENTRMRAASSKDLEMLLAWVNSIGFKIEIKGAPVLKQGKWHLFFILPELDSPQLRKMPLLTSLD